MQKPHSGQVNPAGFSANRYDPDAVMSGSEKHQEFDVNNLNSQSLLAGGMVSGDIKVVQNYAFSGSDSGDRSAFFTPQVERNLLSDESWGRIERRFEDLRRNRLLVVSAIEIAEARKAAYTLAARLRKTRASGDSGNVASQILEWSPVMEPIPVHQGLHEQELSSVFLFMDVHPLQLGDALGELMRAVQKSDHYMILTTTLPLAQWSASEDSSVWWELSVEELYSSSYLLNLFLSEIDSSSRRFGEGYFPNGFPETRADATKCDFVAGMTVGEVVGELETPDHLRSFLRAIEKDRVQPQALVIAYLIDKTRNSEIVAESWYLELTKRQQQLAALLLLFNRLSFDQFFALVELLADSVFRSLNPEFEAFDALDLEDLADYFGVCDLGNGVVVVQFNALTTRSTLLDLAWARHRRFLKAILPAVASLVVDASARNFETRDEEILNEAQAKQTKRKKAGAIQKMITKAVSVAIDGGVSRQILSRATGLLANNREKTEQSKTGGTISESLEESADEHFRESRASRWTVPGPMRDLYGSPILRTRFFNATSYAFGELGVRSPFAVESTFIYLSSFPSLEPRKIVARALSSWRLHEGGAEKLFRVLEEWMRDSYQRQMLWRSQYRGRVQENYGRLRSTVALCLGLASQYDSSNELPAQFLKLVELLHKDSHPEAIGCFKMYTIPALMRNHLEQLEPWLAHLVLRLDFVESIALGWERACRESPKPAFQRLRTWHTHSLSMVRGSARDSPRVRHCRLAMVAMAYGFIGHNLTADGRTSPLSGSEALEEMITIHRTERHSFVRIHIVRSLVFQMMSGNEKAEDALLKALQFQSSAEDVHLYPLLMDLYREQRFELVGGEDLVSIGGLPFDLWYSEPRPKTPIELIFERWILDPEKPAAARQMALRSLVMFSDSPVDAIEEVLRARYTAFKAWLPIWHRQQWNRIHRWSLMSFQLPALREAGTLLLAFILSQVSRIRTSDLVPVLSSRQLRTTASLRLRLLRWRRDERKDAPIRNFALHLRLLSYVRPEWATAVLLMVLIWFSKYSIFDAMAAVGSLAFGGFQSVSGLVVEWMGEEVAKLLKPDWLRSF